jgi:hypothetical protein
MYLYSSYAFVTWAGQLYLHYAIQTNLPTNQHRVKDKGKAIPLQAWTGPEGYRRLSLPYFKTIST